MRDLTGALQAWIEVGAPDAGRLHKAAKAAPKVTVYTHRDVDSCCRGSPASAFTVRKRCGYVRSTANCLPRWSRDSTDG